MDRDIRKVQDLADLDPNILKIKEFHHVITEKHPYHESLKEKLMKDIDGLKFYTPEDNYAFTNIRGSQYNFDKNEPKSVRLITQWIYNLILGKYSSSFIGLKEEYLHTDDTSHPPNISSSSWFARYNEGELTWKHDHKHALLGYVYFINSPKGSSPLVFSTSGKRIKPEEGTVVIFPGTLMHHVPKNRCNNRLILAGNIVFDLNN